MHPCLYEELNLTDLKNKKGKILRDLWSNLGAPGFDETIYNRTSMATEKARDILKKERVKILRAFNQYGWWLDYKNRGITNSMKAT